MRERRNLSRGEESLTKYCFKQAINTRNVFVVKRMTTGKHHTAWAPFGNITFPKADFQEDFIGDDMFNPPDINAAHWFLHEMAHVWQHAVGMPLVHLNFKNARQERKTGIDRYEYSLAGATYGLSPIDLLAFNTEQQGDIIADYFGNKLWGIAVSDPVASYEKVLAKFLADPMYPRYTKTGWRLRAGRRNLSA